MQQWWLWWCGFAAAPICSKVVVALRCCSGGDSTTMVVRCLRSRWRCSLHLVRRSRWRDDRGLHLDVRSRFAQVVDLSFCWLQVVAHDVGYVAEKKTKLCWPECLLLTRVAATMVMERDDEN